MTAAEDRRRHEAPPSPADSWLGRSLRVTATRRTHGARPHPGPHPGRPRVGTTREDVGWSRSGRSIREHLRMSIAPLHGRPAPLLFVRKRQTQWPRYRPAQVRAAPLSTRARRLRRRRLWTTTLSIMTAMAVVAIAAWAVWMWRG
jgi:hypothetical protein